MQAGSPARGGTGPSPPPGPGKSRSSKKPSLQKSKYILTNISPKKVYQHTNIDGEPGLSIEPGLGILSSAEDNGLVSRTTTHRNFIALKNAGEGLERKAGPVKYVDLANWWKTHKNSL